MSTEAAPVRTRRVGAETRRQAQQVALRLFTQQGYDTTSLRQIADELGINKASLYYYFPSKEAILRSLVQDRGTEAQELLDWLDSQVATSDLLEKAVLRWVDSFSIDKLRGIRFLRANPHLARVLGESDGAQIGGALTVFAERLAALTPKPTPERVLLTRMAVLSINAAVEAAADTVASDDTIVSAARSAAHSIVHVLTAT